MTARQYLDWQDFAAQFGLGIDRDDIHWGMLLSMFFNVNRDSGAPKPAEDFMPYRRTEEMSDEDFLRSIQHSVAAIKALQP